MPPHVARNILLVGFMGTGKSSVARALARKTGGFLVDTDLQIEKKAGTATSVIFAEKGEAFFRDAETALLLASQERSGQIISTGGGMVLRAENRRLLKRMGLVVWLRASEAVIFDRVSRNDKRPLLQTADPRATLHALLQTREALYREVAQLEIDTGETKRPEVIRRVLETAGWKCKAA